MNLFICAMSIFILGSLVAFSTTTRANTDACRSWFEKAKLHPGPDCLISCASSATLMNTFYCTEQCDDLCEESSYTRTLFSIANVYGLTPDERALVAKFPLKALEAYRLSWKAEHLCASLYKASLTNDESDACRHFVWAFLLTKELGVQFANDILNAHEQDPRQPKQERAMDLANNRQGQLANLGGKRKQSDGEIIEIFKENLKRGKLVILAPKLTNKRDGR